MTILSIDPGTHLLGWALTTPDQVLDAGLIQGPRDNLDHRFLALYAALGPIFDQAVREDVDLVAIETYGVSSQQGTDAVKGLIGIIRLVAAQQNLPTTLVSATTVKKMVAGHGFAQKEAVARAVHRAYPLSSRHVDPNVTDAIAVGLAVHLQIAAEEAGLDQVRQAIEQADGILTRAQLAAMGLVDGTTKSERVKTAGRMLAVLASRYTHERIGNRYVFHVPWVSKEEPVATTRKET